MSHTKGWLTGKFAPLHAGHINLIQQAATQCDELTVVMSHSAKRFDDPKLELKNRLIWLRQAFRDLPHIKVVWIDETDIPEYPNGWAEWAQLVKNKIGDDFDYVFTSELNDIGGYHQHFNIKMVKVIDAGRLMVPISGTEIRNDPKKHWGNSQDGSEIAATDEPSASQGDHGWLGKAGIPERLLADAAQRVGGSC